VRVEEPGAVNTRKEHLMKRRPLTGWLVLLCIAAAGCGSPTEDTMRRTNTAATGAEGGAAANRLTAEPRRPKPRPKGPNLRNKFSIIGYGGSDDAPDCARDLSSLPPGFATSPAVWMSSVWGPSKRVFTYDNGLCLHGFTADRPVTVTITVDRRHYATTVQPVSGELTNLAYEPPETLFNRAPLRVYGIGSGLMQSEAWDFVPQSTAREGLAAAGHFTISATQGSTKASYRQSITVPPRPLRSRLRGDRNRRLAVAGFKRGEAVPIGLYRLSGKWSTTATLIRKIGTVVMPRSRTAVFTVPRSATGSKFCVTVPLEVQTDCPGF
jgi:hypothetical protein